MNRIKLVIGDWSRDGHEKSDDIYIETNFTKKEIEKAYKKGTKKLSFNLSEEVARQYDDHYISKKYWEELKKLGCKIELDDEDEREDIFICVGDFADIYLFIVGLGNSEFQYKIVEEQDRICIGGYGLYS